MIDTSQLLFVFCPPLLGKPNPQEPRPAEGPDTRERIIQNPPRGSTCWYAVFNILRERYKAPNTQDSRERKFEKIASMRRKAVSEHERSMPDIASQLNTEIIKEYFSTLTKEVVQQGRGNVRETLRGLDAHADQVKLLPFLPGFLEQTEYENLYDYLLYLMFTKRLEIDNLFFFRLQVDPKDLFESSRRVDPGCYAAIDHGERWENLCPILQELFLDNLVRMLSAQSYGLQISSWHPSQPFESFVKELEKNGPLCVGGSFGRPHYRVPAEKLDKCIQGRDVYGWSRSAPRNPSLVSGHTVLLVGAEKTRVQNLVFYIDPLDESDPLCPEKQRIYVMTYGRLTSADSICDFHGFLRNDAPAAVGYALYRRKPGTS